MASHRQVGNSLYLSAFHLREDNIDDYISIIRAFKPKLIWSFPSVLYVLAQLMKEKGVPPVATLQAITTSAEMLFPHFRKEIETAFGGTGGVLVKAIAKGSVTKDGHSLTQKYHTIIEDMSEQFTPPKQKGSVVPPEK